MTISFCTEDANPQDFFGDALILILGREEDAAARLGCKPGKTLAAALAHLADCGDLLAKPDQMVWLYPALMRWGREKPWLAQRLLLLGLDSAVTDQNQLAEKLRLLGGLVAGQLRKIRAKEAALLWPDDLALSRSEAAAQLATGFALGGYSFSGYRLDKEKLSRPPLDCRLHFLPGDAPAEGLLESLQRVEIEAAAVYRARDMANTPANYWTPASFGKQALQLGKMKKLKASVLDRADLQRQGLEALLAVSRGSAEPPTLSVLEYRPAKSCPTVLLVGKGLTFDSGGLCLKAPANMHEMKYDMCGGAVVMAVMQALPALGLRDLNVVGLVPATENLSGAAAVKPGDVVRHFDGRYSEIVNTDAEGRLILADAIAWGLAAFRPDAVLDVATLTGAAIVGLGHHYSGLLSNNEALATRLLTAGEATGEPFWRLPLGTEYRKQLDSTVADIKNAGDRSGGTITAACYLQEFVGNTPWAHLDIAGTAWNFTKKAYVPKGPSGVGVRTLLHCLTHWDTK